MDSIEQELGLLPQVSLGQDPDSKIVDLIAASGEFPAALIPQLLLVEQYCQTDNYGAQLCQRILEYRTRQRPGLINKLLKLAEARALVNFMKGLNAGKMFGGGGFPR